MALVYGVVEYFEMDGRDNEVVLATFDKFNVARSVRKKLQKHGFDVAVVGITHNNIRYGLINTDNRSVKS